MYYDKTSKIIELIYESAINPSKWTELLNSIAELVDNSEKLSENDDVDKHLLSAIPAKPIAASETLNASLSDTLKSITDINLDDTQTTSINLAQTNEILMGHFVRAIKIAKRLVDVDEQHNTVLSLLDRMPIALVLVDAKGFVVEINSLADKMLLSETGFTIKSNKIDFGDDNNIRVLNAIEKMSKHDAAITRGQSLSITNEHTKNNIMLFIAPLRKHGRQQRASVAVFISERKSLPLTLPQEFSDNYGLTKKELNIAGLLAKGLSVTEISEHNSVSTHTVRSHVKSIFNKTQTSRQAELVSLVYNGLNSFEHLVPDTYQSKRTGLLQKSIPLHIDYKIFQLSDGRNLAYSEYGDPNGVPVIHCHSVLGSRLEIAFDAAEISKKHSVRLIVVDRPGYGASDSDPEASFTKWVNDLIQLLDYLMIETFSLTGYAMGGLFALACAHQIPHRLKHVAIVSTGITPKSSEDYKTMIPLYKMNTLLAKNIPKIYSLLTGILVKGILSEPETFFEQFNEYLDSADQDIMNSGEFKANMFSSLTESFRLGGKAASKEVAQFMHNWEFDISEITTPVSLWHGTSDFHVPVALGKRLSEHLNDAHLHIKEGQGHYLFYTHWNEILSEMAKKR